MSQILRAYGPLTVPLAFLAAPGVLLVIWLRSRALQGAWRRAAAQTLSVAGCLAVLTVTLQPSATGLRAVELVPFTNLTGAGVSQIVGNLLLFVPWGVAIAAWTLPRWLLPVLPVTVEVLQWLLASGRVSSTEDVLLGSLGALCGFTVAHRMALRAAEKDLLARATEEHVRPYTDAMRRRVEEASAGYRPETIERGGQVPAPRSVPPVTQSEVPRPPGRARHLAD